ncbi:mate-domain-containing protein [Kalaharituber pfeilii]|nr:mate-domain-containing protein [Kalaharituber pfeilii]
MPSAKVPASAWPPCFSDTDDEHALSASSPLIVSSGDRSLHSPDSAGALSGSYRRPPVIPGSYGRPALLSTSLGVSNSCLTAAELSDIENDERRLLVDNRITSSYGALRNGRRARTASASSSRKPHIENGDNAQDRSSGESSSLVGDAVEVSFKWEDAIMEGRIHTTWKRESKVLARYSLPLMVTFSLQYSLTIASILSAGNLGKTELAAVSLAGMTGTITGYAVFQGLATSLDTLCAQAYGAGQKHLVGLHMQRMICFLMVVAIPISIIWYFAESVLNLIVPDKELASLAGSYLRILILGLPGYGIFESGKRFTQAQGLFAASTWVLLITSPINAYLNYALVWHPVIGIGFRGAPVAVVITNYLMPLLLFLYVRFVAGSKCWGGFSKKAWQNWWPMIKLAIPGLLMILAEFLAFEILTLLASYFSTAHVAAQSVISTTCSLIYQIPFALSIACSTRVANFLGATLEEAAKKAAYTGLVAAAVQGCINFTIMFFAKDYLPKIFTSDPEVIALVAKLVDGIAAMSAGILRGQGRQYIGGWVNLISYYVIAVPLSVVAGFVWHWELFGLWTGVSLALCLVAIVETYVVLKTNWQKVVDAANARNSTG